MDAEALENTMFGKLICGCGAPDAVVEITKRLLELHEQNPPDSWERQCELVPHEPSLWMWQYALDNAGLTEHGTTARFSWLTPAGKELLEALRKYGSDPGAWLEARRKEGSA